MNGKRRGGRGGGSRTAAVCAVGGVLLLLTGCGGSAPWVADYVELGWPERQVVFRVGAGQQRLEAYSIRGGVGVLGSVALPPGLCATAMGLEPHRGRLWLWSERGGVEIDGRGLRVLARWEGAARAVPTPVQLTASRLGAPGCAMIAGR